MLYQMDPNLAAQSGFIYADFSLLTEDGSKFFFELYLEVSLYNYNHERYRGYLLFLGEYQIYFIGCVENSSIFTSA